MSGVAVPLCDAITLVTREALRRMQTSVINGMLTAHRSTTNISMIKQCDECVLNRTPSL